MRIFRDLELVEHLGSGIPRILENYSKDVFELKDNYIRVIFPYKTRVQKTTGKKTTGKKTTGKKLKEKITSNPKIL
jgi:predicted HTH transcriptional regulator